MPRVQLPHDASFSYVTLRALPLPSSLLATPDPTLEAPCIHAACSFLPRAFLVSVLRPAIRLCCRRHVGSETNVYPGCAGRPISTA